MNTQPAMNTPALGLMPTMPLDPAWLEQHPAAYAADPLLFKAAFKLLAAAWRGVPCGTVPDSMSFLLECTGLPMVTLTREREVLWHGFEADGEGRRFHPQMKRLADQLLMHHAKEVEGYVRSLALAAQDPEEFALVGMEAQARRKPRGKTELPPGFGFDVAPSLRAWCVTGGYPSSEAQAWIMDKFCSYSRSRAERYKCFESAFRVFATNELRYLRGGRPWAVNGQAAAVGYAGNSGAPLMSRGDAAVARTSDLFEQVGRRSAPVYGRAERSPS